jgi:hypothetical protein
MPVILSEIPKNTANRIKTVSDQLIACEFKPGKGPQCPLNILYINKYDGRNKRILMVVILGS